MKEGCSIAPRLSMPPPKLDAQARRPSSTAPRAAGREGQGDEGDGRRGEASSLGGGMKAVCSIASRISMPPPRSTPKLDVQAER